MKKQGVVTSQHILLPFTRELPMESFNLEYYRAFYTVAQTGNVNNVWWAFLIAEFVSILMSLAFYARINKTTIAPLYH